MAGQRLTDKTELDTLAKDDLLMVVDVDDTTGSADGTSKKIQADNLITTNITTILTGDVNQLNTASQIIVPTAGANRTVMPLSVMIECIYSTTQNTNNQYLFVGYDDTNSTRYWNAYKGFYYNISATTTFCMTGNGVSGGMLNGFTDNLPLKIWTSGAYNGDWAMKVYATYHVIDMA